MELFARGIETELRDILSVSRAAAITGPRQAGKSTLAKQLQLAGAVPNYFTLDDQATRAAALADPDGFALALPRPAVIDEVQRAPDLMLAIKQILDHDQTPGQFLLTGSADLVTSRVIADALPGRVQYVNLWPLSRAEISGQRGSVVDSLLAGTPPHVAGAQKGRAAGAEIVVAGGFPGALALSGPQRARFFRSYVQAVLGRDLPEIGRVGLDHTKLEQLLRLVAARTSGLANYSALGRDLGLDDKTVKRTSNCCAALPAVQAGAVVSEPRRPAGQDAEAAARRQRMAAALIGADATRYSAPDQGMLAGMLLETFVVMELVKQATWSSETVQLYFYRDTEKREVDVVIESLSGDIAAVEQRRPPA